MQDEKEQSTDDQCDSDKTAQPELHFFKETCTLQMKQEAGIIICVFPDQMSISKAQGAEGHCQYGAETANYHSVGIILL